jgi:tripartite-type tricarboxylate transporter receptor subunit TctC
MQQSRITRRQLVAGLAGVAGSAIGLPSLAQSGYPNRPIRIIVPWPAGGGSDVSTRLLVPGLTQRLGQPVVIDNRPGASGAIGHALAAKSPADGYTLLYSTADTHSMVPHLYKQPNFDARRDFVGIGTMGLYPLGIAVHSSVPARNLQQFVQWIKAAKTPVTCASVGTGSAGHILLEAFKDMARTDLLHVPYQGGAPMMQGLLANQVTSTFTHVVTLDQHLRAGTVRMIAVTSRERLPNFPDVPTFKEQGIPLENGSWGGIVAPAGTPPEIVARLHDALEATIADPVPAETNRNLSTVVEKMSQPDFHRYMLAEYERWGKYIRDAKITITQ